MPFDTFVPQRDRQLYTCVEAGTRYAYQSGDGSFRADILVDEDGLVLDYPPLFQQAPF